MPDCIFCKIIKKEIPAEIVFESDLIVAFPDIHPSADYHILIIPKAHIGKIEDLNPDHGSMLAEIFKTAAKLAKEQGFDSIYRVVVNAGKAQQIPHLHFHLLGGKWHKKV